jgi:hypothetical protein
MKPSNLCASCKNSDTETEFRAQVYQEVEVCLYQRSQFPKATKCVDFELETEK